MGTSYFVMGFDTYLHHDPEIHTYIHETTYIHTYLDTCFPMLCSSPWYSLCFKFVYDYIREKFKFEDELKSVAFPSYRSEKL